jgi:hypothetical protein
MITLGLAFLLGLTIYVGVRWQLQSLPTYFTGVVAAFALWAGAFTLQTYTAILPLVLGALASLLLALVGLSRRGEPGKRAWAPGVMDSRDVPSRGTLPGYSGAGAMAMRVTIVLGGG